MEPENYYGFPSRSIYVVLVRETVREVVELSPPPPLPPPNYLSVNLHLSDKHKFTLTFTFNCFDHMKSTAHLLALPSLQTRIHSSSLFQFIPQPNPIQSKILIQSSLT